ncbi:hypothetical protein DRO32_03120 [Candidatus Bathyarchaeota archaeon]|nr:MAG: hypothetical protein DRO32_03120 [Candidatus Bathyarchaeota archaeon]
MEAGAELKQKLLELLKTDEEFRLAVAGLIGLGEVLRRLEEHDEKFNQILERLDRHEAELARLREDMNKGFERYDRELAKLREDMNKGFELLRRHVDALGARWGLLAEDAFREGLKGIVRELGLEVERWMTYDGEGLVYGHPSMVEVDVAVKDGLIILVEISSHVRPSDLAAFKRKAELYARETGREPDRLIIITPYADGKALKMAEEMGIYIYTKV